MKLLYVGDNRNRLNWGCRATSIALRQLLDSRFNVEKVIYGNYVAFAPESGLKVKTTRTCISRAYHLILQLMSWDLSSNRLVR
ncbi:MAG: hypothetical protein RLZZ86_2945 [Cyanobacteriota bacterium]